MNDSSAGYNLNWFRSSFSLYLAFSYWVLRPQYKFSLQHFEKIADYLPYSVPAGYYRILSTPLLSPSIQVIDLYFFVFSLLLIWGAFSKNKMFVYAICAALFPIVEAPMSTNLIYFVSGMSFSTLLLLALSPGAHEYTFVELLSGPKPINADAKLPLFLIGCLAPVAFGCAFVAKIEAAGSVWLGGNLLEKVFLLRGLQTNDQLTLFLSSSTILTKALSIAVIALEASFGLVLFYKRARLPLIGAALVFHFLNYLIFDHNFFVIYVGIYLVYVDYFSLYSRFKGRGVAVCAIAALLIFAPSAGFSETPGKKYKLSTGITLSPELKMEMLSGRTLKLGELRGKVVLINYWASYCTPCTDEMPSLYKIYSRMKDKGFELISVVLSNPSLAEAFLTRKFGLPTFQLYKPNQDILNVMHPYSTAPLNVLVDKFGVVRLVHDDLVDWNGREKIDLIEKLMRQGPNR